jgi:hypothetical protein
MVNICRSSYMNGWSYEITASVPHQWASEKFKHLSGHGYCGLCTAYADVVRISLDERDPKFKEHFAFIVTNCIEKEDDAINKINARIVQLQEEKTSLLSKTHGKYGGC